MLANRALLQEEEVCRSLIQDAYRNRAETVEFRNFAARKNFCPCRREVFWSNHIFEQMLLLRPMSLHGGRAFIYSPFSQRTYGNYASGFHTRGSPQAVEHLTIQIESRLSFFRTPFEIDSEERYALNAKARIHTQKSSGTDRKQ